MLPGWPPATGVLFDPLSRALSAGNGPGVLAETLNPPNPQGDVVVPAC